MGVFVKKLLYAALLPLCLGSSILALVNPVKDFADELRKDPITVKVQPDFSEIGEGMGEAIGTAMGKAVEQGLQNVAEKFANAANSDQFKDNLQDGFTGLTNAAKGALESNELKKSIKDTVNAGASLGDQFTENIVDATKKSKMGEHAEEAMRIASEKLATAGANAANNKQLQTEAERASEGGAKIFSAGARGARKEWTGKNGLFNEIGQITQGAIGSVFNYRNAMQFALPTAAGTIIALSAYYGPKVFWNVLEQRLLTPKPAILLPGSKYGRKDRLHRWWTGYKTPPMIFDASVKERLEEIEEKTRNIRDHIYQGQKITYDNLLLYGNPGTGKTLFAEILADKTNMDILKVTAASLLQSGVEGIKYFDELITMANKSKYGVIIFVDEADALFVDRDTLKPDSDHYKVLNHILAVTGSGSNKFMLIAATNHAYVMDPAMGRRFQDRVLMPLPDANTRKELLHIYMDEQLFNEKNRSAQFISAANSILTNAKIKSIVEQTAGLSHAEIKDMVTIMGKKANATKDGIITRRNVDTAVSEAIEKKKALERDLLEREQKMAAKGG